MATRDLPRSPQSTASQAPLPRLNLFTMFRLGLFQMGLGLLSLLTLGILNQVLISELRIPGVLASGAIAMYQFVAPARVWFGQMSDAKPIAGYHRTGYVWVGLGLQAICLLFAIQVVWQLGASAAGEWTAATYGWLGLLAATFAAYGLCISFSGTPFAALLVDVSDEDNRSQLVGIVWAMLMVGIVAGAIAGEQILENVAPGDLQAAITRLFIGFPLSVVVLGILATLGIEKKYSRYRSRSSLAGREDQITLKQALSVLTASKQTGFFFVFLLVMTVSLFLQQPVLEPYAREVFGLSIGESAGLNQFWGYGILAGIGLAGFLIVPRLGKQRTAMLGCLLSSVCFVLIILSGITANPTTLRSAVMLFGLASGILTNSAVSLMLDLTAAETAGTFIGAWGLAQALAQASATVLGGALLDLGRQVFSQTFLAFSLVFACQSVGMVIAFGLLTRINVTAFKVESGKAIATLMELDLD
ncbi:MAG: BCD family MFS transporter [Leptolyngbya sp. SIO1E4]|nr:BCD family MFS transporter [Leptolyngbya sp. SIO1E4]